MQAHNNASTIKQWIKRRVIMKDNCRKVLMMGLVMLALIGMAAVGVSSADQTDYVDEQGGRAWQDMPECARNSIACHPPGVPVAVLQSGRGFALKDNESHVLRINVENLIPLEPMFVRGLMSSNKTLEQIREEIENKGGAIVQRGSMRLDQRMYSLTNIELTPSSNNTTVLQADVVDPGKDSNPSDAVIVGRIRATISPRDGEVIGRGWLEMNDGSHAGRFEVLLDMQPPMHRAGMKMPRR
jgi:hypothetical protein